MWDTDSEPRLNQEYAVRTTRDLYMEERRHEILRRVQDHGRVSVSDLSQTFNVSEVTVRADLHALTEKGLIVRTHGGAVPASEALQDMALANRERLQISEKGQIGQASAALVEQGDAIYLDSSSTALAIARYLKGHHQVTVITTSIAVAQALLDAPGVTVVMPGGTIQRDTASLIGTDGLANFERFHIQKGFFGAHGLAILEGLTDISADVVNVKRPMVAMCRQVVAVVDATKWNRVGLASFADLTDIDCIITDAHAPSGLVEQVQALGVDVVLV